MNDQLHNELEEQARLLGMSAERECDLRGKVERLERERDAALLGYNECRATIEDARVALNAHEHEGLLLASLRVRDQLAAERALADRLAKHLEDLLSGCFTPAFYEASITAWKEARSE